MKMNDNKEIGASGAGLCLCLVAPCGAVHSERPPLRIMLVPHAPSANPAVVAVPRSLRLRPPCDASTLKPDDSLAGRDLSGFTLKGDFSGCNFDDCNMENAVLANIIVRDASMQRVKAWKASMQKMNAR